MSKQQLELMAGAKDRAEVDTAAIEAFIRGEKSFTEALKVTDQMIEGLRRQAIALLSAGKYEKCMSLVSGVVALGSSHPVDAHLMARCHEALGDAQTAARFAELCAEMKAVSQ